MPANHTVASAFAPLPLSDWMTPEPQRSCSTDWPTRQAASARAMSGYGGLRRGRDQPDGGGRVADDPHDVSGDLGEKARRRVVAETPGEVALAGRQEVEALLGPGDAHVGEAALLLELVRIRQGADVREHAVLHPEEEDDGKLKPLGVVQGHERDRGRLLVVVV